jgi:G protein-coupled receptor kinase interacting protein 2
MSFVCPSEESEGELSEQLISSVRTANLETSLRLIAQGANTNYLHPVPTPFIIYF